MAIRHKRKNSAAYAWQAGDLVEGQIGLNIADGTLHFDKADGSTVTILPGAGGLANVVEDTTPQLGGNLDVQANIITTSTTNGNITITPDGTGNVILSADTVQIGDSNANATITTNGTGDLVLNTNAGTNSGVITITSGASGAITLDPDGSGDIQMIAGTTRFGITNLDATIATSGTGDLILRTNQGSGVEGQITIADGANGDITIAPNGSGKVHFETSETRVGINNTNAKITTKGTGDLTLDTNSGTNSGSITIADGVNGNITITPDGTGQVLLTADTVRVGDLNTGANITTYGTGNLTLSTNGGTNSGTIQINQGAAGNILITPNTTGDIFLESDTIYVGDSGVTANLSSSGVADLVLGTNSLATGGSITIGSAASSPITIQPDGTGDLHVNADTLRLGDSASAATLTTNGAGNLTINTNGGTTTGSIIIATGTNGNMTLACNGTGVVVASSPIVAVVGTATVNTPAIFARHTVTASASDTYPSINIQKHRSDIAFTSMTDEPSVINFQVRDSTSTNRTFFRMIGRYAGTATNPTFTLRGSADGFTTNLHYMSIGGGIGTFGNASSNYTLTSNTGGNLILTANSNTTSGTITIASGADANITLTPNGTGSVVLDGLNWPQADGTNGQVLTTNGSGQTSWSTASGGSIQVAIAYASTTFYTGTKYLNWNSEASDINGLITVGSNGTFTISSAGTYLIELASIITQTDRNPWELYDQTGSAILKTYTSGLAASGGYGIIGGWCFIHVITASNIYRWQCPSTGDTTVSGTPILKVTKLA